LIYVVFPHGLYRQRYLHDYNIDHKFSFDEAEDISLFSFSISSLKKLANFIRSLPDSATIQCHTTGGAFFSLILCRLYRKKSIYVCHGSLSCSRIPIYRFIGNIIEFVNCLFCNKFVLVSPIIVNYSFVFRFFSKYKMINNKYFGVYNYNFPWIDLNLTSELPIKIAFVGRRESRKGFLKYLVLCSELESKFPNLYEYHVFGLGMDIPDNLRNKIIDHGFVNDKEDIYRAIDCVVCLSDFEGFCDVAAEALSYGKLAIHDKVPGMDWCPFVFDSSSAGFHNAIQKYRSSHALTEGIVNRMKVDIHVPIECKREIYVSSCTI
jgi:glycosyltransferase involved in cell wall biosynthesis